MNMSQHKAEYSLFLYNHVSFSPTSETKDLVLCKIYIHCFISAILEQYQGFHYGTYLTYGLYFMFFLVNSPASEFYMPTFRNTLSVPSF